MINKKYFETLKKVRKLVILHPAFASAIEELNSSYEQQKAIGIPKNMLCIGPSGVGKSTLVEQLRKKHLKANASNEIPILIVKTPSKPTVGNFAESFLMALGDRASKRGTAIDKTNRLITLLKRKQVMMMIVDELQHFVEHGRGNIVREVSDWLKNLIDEAGVSTILMGLERCEEVLFSNEQIRRRFSQTIVLEPFSIEKPQDFKVFSSVVHELDTQIGLESHIVLTKELVTRFYYATNGLIDYLVTLFLGAYEIVLKENKPAISLKVLEESFYRKIWRECPSNQNPFSQRFVLQRLDKSRMPFHVGG